MFLVTRARYMAECALLRDVATTAHHELVRLRQENEQLRQMLAVRVEALTVQVGEGDHPKTIQQADADWCAAARGDATGVIA